MIYFKNPEVQHRAEPFGGVISTPMGIYTLDRETYKTFLNFGIQEIEGKLPKLVQDLVDSGAILSIKKELAEKIHQEQEA